MKKQLLTLLSAMALSMSGSAVAADSAEIAAIKEKLKPLQITPKSITQSEIPGMYQVLDGARILYVSKDAKYLFSGSLYEISTLKNLTDNALNDVRLDMIKSIPTSDMIAFKPEGETKHVVTVFTDIDCGYCRKLHNEMESYTDKGIEVRYLAYPRAGIGSDSYDKAVSVWCANDQQKAMTRAKDGAPVEKKTCDNPVADQYRLSQKMGLTGTPTLILDDGRQLPGYYPADRLMAEINKP